jgi:hypothetical protein
LFIHSMNFQLVFLCGLLLKVLGNEIVLGRKL